MKIENAAVTLESSRKAFNYSRVSASFRVEVVQPQRQTVEPSARVSLSDSLKQLARDAIDNAYKQAALQKRSAPDVIQEKAPLSEDDAVEPRLALLARMIELITGRKLRVMTAKEFDAIATPSKATAETTASKSPATPAPAAMNNGPMLSYTFDYREVRAEVEQTAFAAQGIVRTSDGKEIRFELGLMMERAHYEEFSLSVVQGQVQQGQGIDPLVLNFDGTAAQLQNLRFAFDLDGDGNTEDVPLLGPGSGYLAFDLDGNGRIDSGRELFGPQSGDGFADLAKLDDDGNGWIDENDAAFDKLGIWTPAAEGAGTLGSLRDYGVGALYLGRVATPFAVRSQDNAGLGVIQSSGFYLREDGRAGAMQHLDLLI